MGFRVQQLNAGKVGDDFHETQMCFRFRLMSHGRNNNQFWNPSVPQAEPGFRPFEEGNAEESH